MQNYNMPANAPFVQQCSFLNIVLGTLFAMFVFAYNLCLRLNVHLRLLEISMNVYVSDIYNSRVWKCLVCELYVQL